MRSPVCTRRAPSSGATIWTVDDDDLVLKMLDRILGRAGYRTRSFTSAGQALEALEAAPDEAVDAVLSDLHMPQMSGIELLQRVHARCAEIPVIVLTGDESARSAVAAMQADAYDYVLKPLQDREQVVLVVARAVERRRLVARNRVLAQRVGLEGRFEGIVGASLPMREVFQMVEAVSPTDATVLLLGESGTGKELLARAIHERSQRRGRAFMAINCSALTETLLESELFGHVRGAFSGASTARTGVFEDASGGTLFLDEIGDVSPAIQVRLLRALQEREIKPVGSNEVRRVDVRVIAATNRDLEAAVRERQFRQDLYYRLNVLPIDVPPLRRRADDVPLLVQHFLARYGLRFGRGAPGIAPEALELLQAYPWPGNVRELENAIQRAVVLAADGVVGPQHLPSAVRERDGSAAPAGTEGAFADAKQAAVDALERRYVEEMLTRTQGNVAEGGPPVWAGQVQLPAHPAAPRDRARALPRRVSLRAPVIGPRPARCPHRRCRGAGR